MTNFRILLTFVTLVTIASALIPLQREKYADHEFDDENYSNTMREKYRNYCRRNLEESYPTWKLFFESVESYCEYAVSKAAMHGAFVRRGPPHRTADDDCVYLENCEDNLPAI